MRVMKIRTVIRADCGSQTGLDVKTYSSEYDYEIVTPSGKLLIDRRVHAGGVGKERFQELVNTVGYGLREKGNNVPCY